MMRVEYIDRFFEDGKEIVLGEKNIELPFYKITVRALILRKKDNKILATIHDGRTMAALPGGHLEDGEYSADAILRELEEENITIIGSDEDWRARIFTVYFPGYQELSLWYLFVVDDAQWGECDENTESTWVSLAEDIWYPNMREKIINFIHTYLPQYATHTLKIIPK